MKPRKEVMAPTIGVNSAPRMVVTSWVETFCMTFCPIFIAASFARASSSF